MNKVEMFDMSLPEAEKKGNLRKNSSKTRTLSQWVEHGLH